MKYFFKGFLCSYEGDGFVHVLHSLQKVQIQTMMPVLI